MAIVKKKKKAQPNNNKKQNKGLKSSQLELTRHAGVSFGSSELLLSHVFIGDRFDNVRSSNEQIRRVLFKTCTITVTLHFQRHLLYLN